MSLLTVVVTDDRHEELFRFEDLPGEPFFDFCRLAEAHGLRYAEIVHPYNDAMLNGWQLPYWLEELPKLTKTLSLTGDQQQSVQQVIRAARLAMDHSGFVWFRGTPL